MLIKIIYIHPPAFNCRYCMWALDAKAFSLVTTTCPLIKIDYADKTMRLNLELHWSSRVTLQEMGALGFSIYDLFCIGCDLYLQFTGNISSCFVELYKLVTDRFNLSSNWIFSYLLQLIVCTFCKIRRENVILATYDKRISPMLPVNIWYIIICIHWNSTNDGHVVIVLTSPICLRTTLELYNNAFLFKFTYNVLGNVMATVAVIFWWISWFNSFAKALLSVRDYADIV